MTSKREMRMQEIMNWAEEFGLTMYEAVYELVFTFYETAGFWTEELEKELQAKSETELIEIFCAI